MEASVGRLVDIAEQHDCPSCHAHALPHIQSSFRRSPLRGLTRLCRSGASQVPPRFDPGQRDVGIGEQPHERGRKIAEPSRVNHGGWRITL